MNVRMLVCREVTLAALVTTLTLGQLGCTNSDSEPDPGKSAYAASGGIPPNGPPQRTGESQGGKLAVDQPRSQGPPDETWERARATPSQPTQTTPKANQPPPGPATPLTLKPADAAQDSKTPLHQLHPDLSLQELVEFLSSADKDMQLIYTGRSGITDPQEARDSLIQIVKMKLEASRRLSTLAESDANASSEGARGELQSLSHLAALGDLKAAEELEELAKANLESSDVRLVSDSRLVMIGFAIESLQNGDDEAADRIVSYVDQIAASEAQADVPAMMVMGQARESLANYGDDDQANRVRDVIIDLFADSPEPEIAQMAAELAGNVRFDAIEKLRGNVMGGETVATNLWREAVETLIDESADLQTVQYLAGASLEFESLGLDELVDATYEEMESRFNDPESATGREVKLAVDARQARQSVIGRVFDPELTEIDGSPLRITDYGGKVVLMPFWATGFPQSLQLVPRLKAIHDANPNKIAIVGMNLDVEGAELAEFLQAHDLGFPSFRAESSATAKIANPVAAKFGMVSMPFVVILDQTGRVSAITFTGHDLEKTVQKLVEQ